MNDDQRDVKFTHDELLRMTTQVVASYLGKNDLSADRIPEIINTIYVSLRDLDVATTETKAEPAKPAVPVRKSVTPEYIICLEDGKKLKMLKRHLRTMYNMSPDDYRAKWGLPADYPMVAPNYAAQRSEFAKQIGLGRTAGREKEITPTKRRRGQG